MISVDEAKLYVKHFNRVFAITQNYESEDYPYGEKDVTHWMFTFLEYMRYGEGKPWKRILEREYDVIDSALVHLEHRFRTFFEASQEALHEHRVPLV